SQVLAAYQDAIEVFRRCGATLYEADLPFSLAELMRYNGTIISAEAWRTHKGDVESEEQPIGGAVRARIKMGSNISHEAYMKALSHHQQCASSWATFMSGTEAMLMPSMPVFACRVEDVDETAGYTAYFNRIANHAGACACTLPGGFSS